MGFKCPICFEDFKHDKKAWEKHCKEKHDGVAKNTVDLLLKITKDDRGKR